MDDMDNTESTVELPKSLAAFGTENFLEVLRDELYENASDFPLEACMDGGGWPDTDSLDFTVSNVSEDEEAIYAEIEAVFTEKTRHSGCADLEDQATPYRGTFSLQISKDDGTATIELDDYEEEIEDEDDEPDIYVDEDDDGDEDETGEKKEREF